MNTSTPARNSAPAQSTAAGFTLMELLLVIAILGVLTTLSLAVLRSANEQARVSATEARIKRIEALLAEELERYEVRRLPISRAELENWVRSNPIPGIPTLVQLNNLRKRLVQDLINVEMPRPLANSNNLGVFPSEELVVWLNDNYSNGPQPLGDFLRAQPNVQSAATTSWTNFSTLPDVDSAELLYQVLVRIDADGAPAIETLGSTCFADTDGDGLTEVLDAWGEPLVWEILQVGIDPNNSIITTDRYLDLTTDWTRRDSVTGMPEGFALLNPLICRDMHQIRAMVYSPRMQSQGIFNTK